MRLTKRQLKRIIREEYSRLKRRGLIRESGKSWAEMTPSERGRARAMMGRDLESKAARYQQGSQRIEDRKGFELFNQEQEVRPMGDEGAEYDSDAANECADELMAAFPDGCGYEEGLDHCLSMGFTQDDYDYALDIVAQMERSS